jgi:RNA polymerase sigma-54 factor
VITLSDEGLPRLRVSRYYRQMLSQKGETGDYVKEKLRAAVWLIKSIEQRQQTLRRVAESLVKFQRDFLDRGVARMRPLVLRDVAQDIGMHESTVSRVVANKYMATPYGIYPLKYFFTNSLRSGQGQHDVAAESVKETIREYISRESPNAPLSDEDIARRLAKNNVIIARRTVAKYRESMGILPSAKRRRPPGSERKAET